MKRKEFALTTCKGSSFIAAGLCDLDGTVVETERVLYAAWVRLAERVGVDFATFDYAKIIGRPELVCCATVAQHFGISRDPVLLYEEYSEIVREMMESDLELRPGVHQFLETVGRVGMPLALVTSATSGHAWKALGKFGLFDVFSVHVCADTPGLIARKPSPAPYLMAAKLLGVDPRRCVAFEDSPTGVASARAAGCCVYGIPHQHSIASGLVGAHELLESLADFNPDTVSFD